MSLRALLTQRGVAGGALRAFGARVAGAGLAFGVGVTVARSVGPDGTGVYFLAVTLATIASVLGRLGLDQLCVRGIAAAKERDEPGGTLRIARDGRLLALGASLATAAVLFALAPLLAERVFSMSALAGALRVAAVGVVPLSFVLLSGECLRGLGRTGESQLVVTAFLPAGTLACLGLFVLAFGARPPVLLAAWSAGACAAAMLAARAWRRVAPRATLSPSDGLATMARHAVPFLGVALLALALPWISTLALAFRGDEAEVGVFAIAYRTATLTTFVLLAVNAAAGPRFAAQVTRGDRVGLARTARRTAVAAASFALPLILCAWIFPGRIMALFGAEFAQSGRVLAILATGQLVNMLTGSVGALLLMSGHERSLRANLLVAALVSVGLHAWLVPARGVEGAAIASALSLALLNILSLISVRRRLAIDVLPLPFVRSAHG